LEKKPKHWLWTLFKFVAIVYAILPSLTSLSFLADGYRQFSRIPKGTLLISNRKIALHLICYLMILVAGVMLACLYTNGLMDDLLEGNSKSKLNQELAIIIMLTFSNLPLIYILYTIILES
jgi:hypothetical protein